jgi:hypothetical protein
MKLLTKEIVAEFKRIGRQEHVKDPVVVVKFFNPTGAGNWYATEYDPKKRLFFGYVSIFGDLCDEWGPFSLDELEGYRGMFRIGIERDLYFKSQPISKVCPKAVM